MTNIAEEEMTSRQIEIIKKEWQVGSAPTPKPYPTRASEMSTHR